MISKQKMWGWLAALCFMGTMLFASAPSLAHSALVSSDPTNGAELEEPPKRIELTFNENIQAGHIRLRDEGGIDVVDAPAALDPSRPEIAYVELKDLDAGTYDVEWSVLSRDGHPVQGKLTFSVLSASKPEAEAPDAVTSNANGSESSTDQAAAGTDSPATGTDTPATDISTVATQETDAAEPESSSGSPWLWVGGGVIAILVLGALLRRRS